MATATILKKTRQQAVVKTTGTGLANISIHDVKYTDQTVDAANVKLNISHLYFCVTGTTTVTRNGNVVITLTGEDNWNFAQETGFVLNDDNSANVSVNYGANTGTVIVTFTKEAGYIDPEQQSLQPWQR